jgi:hypothetical protein
MQRGEESNRVKRKEEQQCKHENSNLKKRE